ncbi:Der1-like protein [Fistulina hepatica ATCC 64428]|uniref:Derlin n=1 Tax=Fistulina hepatica ATCC 64428 TaxID=1128425 RepID=A0A0D7A991_9AGAR|nr:Der1-like protein [Fistulina hepatica ATCC 64428]
MPNAVETWFFQVPPITRAWLACSVLTSVAIQCQLVTPLQLYYSPKSAFLNMQLWRPLTTFFYFGPLSLDFVFHLFFVMRYSRMLEESSFANRRADYFWLLLWASIMLLIFAPLANLPFLSAALAFVPIYIWSRRHPDARVSLFGLYTITAPYLPAALIGLSALFGGSWRGAAADLMGCVVAHIAWFVRDVWPREVRGSELYIAKAPDGLKRLFGDI